MRPVYFVVGLLIVITLLGSAAAAYISNPPSSTPTPTPVVSTPTPMPTLPQSNEKGIQLKTISFPTAPAPTVPASTPLPTTEASCGHDHQKTDACSCIPPETSETWACVITLDQYNQYRTSDCPGEGYVQLGGYPDTNYYCVYDSLRAGYQKNPVGSSWCGSFCYGKPVIYLYPEQPTLVDVTLTIPGRVTESIPQYPENGWKQVLALPGGMIWYQGNRYNELYYETSVTQHIIPDSGVYIPKLYLQSYLTKYTTQLGLTKLEQKEFLEYWLPKLNKLEANYMFFSVLTPEQKESVDHVDITPKPDSFIEFLVYFRPEQTIGITKPLMIKAPPARLGFTAVEWGGTIDSN